MELHFVESIDSTNDELKRLAEETELDSYVLSAGEQTKGRGRSGHTWNSPKGTSISTSVLLRPEIDVFQASQVTILAAIAVSRAIRNLYELETRIKWPNDVLIRNRKVCGILTEMKPKNSRVKWLVVGIGVNVHDTFFPEEIREMATSVDLEIEGRASRKALTEEIWKQFEVLYQKFLEEKSLQFIIDEYNSVLCNRDSEVKVISGEKEYIAKSLGIDNHGRLLVERDSRIEKVDSGEVHVRGLYGYV